MSERNLRAQLPLVDLLGGEVIQVLVEDLQFVHTRDDGLRVDVLDVAERDEDRLALLRDSVDTERGLASLSASQPDAYADYASLSSLSPDSLSLSSGSSSAYSEVGTPPDDMCSSLHGHGTSSVIPPYGVSADNVKFAVNSLPYLSFGTPVSHPRAPMDASYAAGPTPVQHDAGQHVQWQLHADQAYDAGSYPNLAALSVNTTSPPPTQQQVQYHQFQYHPSA
ncbi:hypothetical protein EXIGLDRAFT_766223 [Exidia glandulosa HHB12029]|uniref:Uncharacterized protein n=1 Tax=Exidia glandulosa HHB12029 TaxID=1314781 RepID=A0A165JW29_EXIGL|nr:hypothetical protein EXIGLDRAFT_766223 [Exidia glandulosa HHB12029]